MNPEMSFRQTWQLRCVADANPRGGAGTVAFCSGSASGMAVVTTAHWRQTRGTLDNLKREGAILYGGGPWHGNDTIWRMVYDLNRLSVPPGRRAALSQPQREYVAIAMA